jgi:hypothetical protein
MGGLIADLERVAQYLSQTRLPRLSESDGGQVPHQSAYSTPMKRTMIC